jgi:hypothetical protein
MIDIMRAPKICQRKFFWSNEPVWTKYDLAWFNVRKTLRSSRFPKSSQAVKVNRGHPCGAALIKRSRRTNDLENAHSIHLTRAVNLTSEASKTYRSRAIGLL